MPERDTWLSRYGQSLRFALHVITHPFDGFWDLIHEKRGTMAAAHTFLFLFLPALLVAYFCRKGIRWRNGVLLVFSLIFYSFGEPV